MEDVVAQGGVFLSPLSKYSPQQAARSLDQLARLHAAFWGGRFGSFPWLVSRLEQIAARPLIPVGQFQDFLDGERGEPLPGELRDAARVHRALGALARRSADTPSSLVHGDAHAGNIIELDGSAALSDWQLVQRGCWAFDVAYHIGAVLTPEDRQATERDLLRRYLERLADFGVTPPAWDAAWADYRAHMVYGFYLWGITRTVEPRVRNEFVRRLGLAVESLGSLQLLSV